MAYRRASIINQYLIFCAWMDFFFYVKYIPNEVESVGTIEDYLRHIAAGSNNLRRKIVEPHDGNYIQDYTQCCVNQKAYTDAIASDEQELINLMLIILTHSWLSMSKSVTRLTV